MLSKLSEYWLHEAVLQGKHVRYVYSPLNSLVQCSAEIYMVAPDDWRIVDYGPDHKWLSTWYMKEKDGTLWEYGDDMRRPKQWWKRLLLLGRNIIMRYKKGEGIVWDDGNLFNTGDSDNLADRAGVMISAPCEINHFRSWMLPPIKGPWSSGYQVVAIRAIHDTLDLNGVKYDNVLVLDYYQTWNKQTGGTRFYMAKGIGPVAIQWLAVADPANPIVSEMIYATPEIL